LLKHHLHRDGQPSGEGYSKAPPDVTTLGELAHASSNNERRAMEAEREAVAMYRAYLMRDQVGEAFEGVISAVTSFGAFVEIEEPFVEGLIKTESLGDEPFAFDEIHMRLSGRRTGRTLELGDKVRVEINNVSVIRRRIDFTLLATAASNKLRPTLEPSPRAGIAKRKQAGREVERAQRGRVERGASPSAAASGGKLRLGVSHRGMRDRDEAPRAKAGKASKASKASKAGKPRAKRR
jgi:ribonuclease R